MFHSLPDELWFVFAGFLLWLALVITLFAKALVSMNYSCWLAFTAILTWFLIHGLFWGIAMGFSGFGLPFIGALAWFLLVIWLFARAIS
jgi:hypothetical protein